MALNLTQLAGPVMEPVSLVLAKLHCGVDASFFGDDPLFGVYIPAARAQAEAVCNRAFFNQTWQRTIDNFPLAASFDYSPSPADRWNWPVYGGMWNRLAIDLPKGRALAINSIGYIDGDGNPQTLVPSQYQADLTGIPCRLVPSQAASGGMVWPFEGNYMPGSVTIQWQAGSYVALVTESFTVPISSPFQYQMAKASVTGVASVVNGSTPVAGWSIAYPPPLVPGQSTLTLPSAQAGGTLTVSYYIAAAPSDIQAALLLVGHFYRNREATTDLKMADLPQGVRALLGPHVVEWTDYRPC
jgi:hypothetical protein